MSYEEPEPTRDVDDTEDSGLPEEEHDVNPMGVEEEDDHEKKPGEDQPGIPTEGEPEIPG